MAVTLHNLCIHSLRHASVLANSLLKARSIQSWTHLGFIPCISLNLGARYVTVSQKADNCRTYSTTPTSFFAANAIGENGMNLSKHDHLLLRHYPSIDSTQDECKRLIREGLPVATTSPYGIAVSATEQLHGRGTKERKWIGKKGNVFVSIAVPMDLIPVPVSLLPLKMGSIVACQTQKKMRDCESQANVSVKWPNDVLVEGKKIAGVLVETEQDKNNKYWFIIGIGINVAVSPRIDSVGPERGRPSACVRGHCIKDFDGDDVEEAKKLALDISQAVWHWVADTNRKGLDSAARDVLTEWKKWAAEWWGQELEVRDSTGHEIVVPVRVEANGMLTVRFKDGTQTLLPPTDYLL